MPIVDIHSTIVMYGDGETPTQNPQRRFVDWSRHLTGVRIENPSVREYVAQPGEQLSIFSGVRSTAIDNTTEFDLTLNPVKDSTYRLTGSGGTAPGFRTARVYDATNNVHTMTVNNNATMSMEIGVGNFGASVGDWVFIPDTTTGDSASPFNVANTGFWVVIAATATKLTMIRRVGEDFNGVDEAPTVPSGSIQIFSSAGVQIGDVVKLSSGFSQPTLGTYEVAEVTSNWIEFVSATPLPLESGIIPLAANIIFYSDFKRFVRVEADQLAIVRLNGDTGNTNEVAPLLAGDPEAVGHFEKWGPVWELKVVNQSTVNPMKVTVISAE